MHGEQRGFESPRATTEAGDDRQVAEGVVGEGVVIARPEREGVAQGAGALHLWAFEALDRACGQGAVHHREAREHSRGPEKGQGQAVRPCPAAVVGLSGARLGEVDELVLAEAVVEDAQPARLHEAPGRIGGEGLLARSPFGDKAAFDDIEGALGARMGGRLGQGEPGPQPVVAAGVVEAGGDPDQLLTGAELDPGAHDHLALAGAGATALVDPFRPPVGALGDRHRPDGAHLRQ